jgi:hypothetical protein
VSYIPLETNKDCLIGNSFSFPTFTKEYIFIETGGIVLQFDKQGKFVRRINKNGQGPNECYAREFAVCEKKESIYIFDNWNLSVYIFDFSGKHIKTIKNPFPDKKVGIELERSPSNINCDKEGNIFYSFDNARGDMKYKYAVVNDNGEILHKSPNYIKYNLYMPIISTSVGFSPIYEVGDDCYYSYNFNDTIFRINNEDYTTSAAYIIKLPNRLSLEDYMRVNADDINSSSLSGKIKFHFTKGDKQYLYICLGTNIYSKDSKHFFSRYNIQTKQLMENINIAVKNDWDGGMDVNMLNDYQQENRVYTMLQPFKMKEMLANGVNKEEAKYPEKQKAFKEMVDNMEEDDNPFIMIVKLK